MIWLALPALAAAAYYLLAMVSAARSAGDENDVSPRHVLRGRLEFHSGTRATEQGAVYRNLGREVLRSDEDLRPNLAASEGLEHAVPSQFLRVSDFGSGGRLGVHATGRVPCRPATVQGL